MRLMEFLSEYEMDYAQVPVREEKLKLKELQGKHFVVVGDSNPAFAKAILYSLFNLNDEKKLNIHADYISLRDGENEKKEFAFLEKNREDFTVGSFENIKKGDFVVFTGLCNHHIEETPLFFADTIALYEEAFSYCERKVIFLSDYRVFGKTRKDYFASEFEQTACENLASQLLITMESLVAIYAKQRGYQYQILRTAMAAGVDIEFDHNLLYQLTEAICQEKELEIIRSSNKYSFVYVNDIIRGIYFGMLKFPMNTTYHLSGKCSDVTTGTLTEYIYQNFPKRTKINLNYGKEDPAYGVALNCDKVAIYGFESKVSVEDALILMIKSRLTKPGEVFVFDGSYQGKLAQIHDLLLAYLLEVDRICKKHDIKYFLAGGTLLGAIRHKGFIPWDDDADVMMLREDYEKFLKVVQQELPPNMKMQTRKTEKGNHNVFTKIRIDNTLFATKFTGQFPTMHNGIFIDVVCHDQTANSKWGQKLHLVATLGTRSMVFNKWGSTPIDTEGFPKALTAIGNWGKKHLPFSFLEWLQDRTISFFSKRKSSKYLYDGMGRNLRRGSFPKEWLDEAVYVDFEGCRLPVPKEYDKYLTYLYGDYMQMIPVSERRMSHSIVWLDLGEYSNFQRLDTKE